MQSLPFLMDVCECYVSAKCNDTSTYKTWCCSSKTGFSEVTLDEPCNINHIPNENISTHYACRSLPLIFMLFKFVTANIQLYIHRSYYIYVLFTRMSRGKEVTMRP